MPAVTRPAFREHSPAAAQIMADWADHRRPGGRRDDHAAPARPRHADDRLRRPGAMELQYVGDELIARINAHLGGQTGPSLRFTQAGMPPQPPPAPPPPPEAVAEAEAPSPTCPTATCAPRSAALGRVVIGRSKPSTTHA